MIFIKGLKIPVVPLTPQEALWAYLNRAIQQSSAEVIGFTTKRNKDWFDDSNQEIQNLLMDKMSVHHLAQPTFVVTFSASFERSRMCGGPTLQRELGFVHILVTIMGSRKL